ncbi:MAG: hypothetical protein H6586_01535 [Flavobacteriales bacterium]|nr:hypothetical protein [Flavobacteriales bacterium]
MKNLVLILIILIAAQTGFGQEDKTILHELINSFECPKGWKMELSLKNDFKSFYDKNQVGLITFTNETRFVELMVYKNEVLKDSLFNYEHHQQDINSSCKNFNTSGPFIISSFEKLDLFIVPRLCPNCDFEEDKKCKLLAKEISIWIHKSLK